MRTAGKVDFVRCRGLGSWQKNARNRGFKQAIARCKIRARDSGRNRRTEGYGGQ